MNTNRREQRDEANKEEKPRTLDLHQKVEVLRETVERLIDQVRGLEVNRNIMAAEILSLRSGLPRPDAPVMAFEMQAWNAHIDTLHRITVAEAQRLQEIEEAKKKESKETPEKPAEDEVVEQVEKREMPDEIKALIEEYKDKPTSSTPAENFNDFAQREKDREQEVPTTQDSIESENQL